MGNASGATSTIARIALLAWRVASQARPLHASDPHITAISSAHARPAATTDRNAWRSGASGRSNTNDTNAAVVSTMYALVTAPRRPPLPPPMTSSATLTAPIAPAIGCDHPDGWSDAGVRINNAAQGRPTRLGGAQSTNATSARSRRHHDGFVFMRCDP